MTRLITSKDLDAAIEFWTPGRYTTGAFARNPNGTSVRVASGNGVTFCAIGAVAHMAKLPADEAEDQFYRDMGARSDSEQIHNINDRQGHAAAVEELKRWRDILRAKEEP